MKKKAVEILKWIAFRAPLLDKIGAPRYPYKINPGQLAFLAQAIDDTRRAGSGGCILEVGVARGMTSFFLAKHLASTGDSRRLVLLDTFSGFDKGSLDHEVNHRGKSRGELTAFRYNSSAIFKKQIRNIGYENLEVIRDDATKFDYLSLAPIDVVLLDIDLYLATKASAQRIWTHLRSHGSILVDDCLPDSPWDGSLQAYIELCEEWGLTPRLVGGKGGVLSKQEQRTLGAGTQNTPLGKEDCAADSG